MKPRGFTLIELLVVVVIVGVLAAALVLAVGGSGERRLEREAERFRALLEQGCTQAELGGTAVGVRVAADGYTFRRLDGARWGDTGQDVLRARQWPEAMHVELQRAGRRLDLAAPEREAPQLVCFASGELTPFSLLLSLGDLPQRYRIDGRDDGTLALQRVDAPR